MVAQSWSYMIGVGLAVGSSIVSNLGVNIQKLAHKRQAQTEATASSPDSPSNVNRPGSVAPTKKSVFCNPTWLAGILLVVVGSIADFAALGFADQIVIAPLGSVTLITNLLFAPMISDEKLTRKDVAATLTIVTGCVLCVAFASHDDQSFTVDEIFAFFEDPHFFFFALIIVSVLFALWRIVYTISQRLTEVRDVSATSRQSRRESKSESYGLRKPTGTFNTSENSGTLQEHSGTLPELSGTKPEHSVTLPEVTGTIRGSELRMLITPTTQADNLTFTQRLSTVWWGRVLLLQVTRFGYGALAGIVGAQSVLFAKATSSLFHGNNWHALEQVRTYLLLSGLFLTIFLQIKWQNDGLRDFDALVIIPIFQAFWIGTSVVGGMIVYKESQDMEWYQLAMFGVGICVTLLGVSWLADHKEARIDSTQLKKIQEEMEEDDVAVDIPVVSDS